MSNFQIFVIVLLLSVSDFIAAKCLPNSNENIECRYPKGDLWCSKNGGGKEFAFTDSCLIKNVVYRFIKDHQKKEGIDDDIYEDGVYIKQADIIGDNKSEIIASYGIEAIGGSNTTTNFMVVFDKDYQYITHNQIDSNGKFIRVSNKKMTFETLVHAIDDCMSCPSLKREDTYAFKENKFIKVNSTKPHKIKKAPLKWSSISVPFYKCIIDF